MRRRDEKPSLPQIDNFALGLTSTERNQNSKELKRFRTFFVWLMCGELRSELERSVDEEDHGRGREFKALLEDPSLRDRFHSGFGLLMDLENLLRWSSTHESGPTGLVGRFVLGIVVFIISCLDESSRHFSLRLLSFLLLLVLSILLSPLLYILHSLFFDLCIQYLHTALRFTIGSPSS